MPSASRSRGRTAPGRSQLGPVGTQFWSQSSPGIGITAQADAHFGSALAAGDFDCDGFDDLAIGMPDVDMGAAFGAGRVLILYSGPFGPASDGRQVWDQNSSVIEDDAELNDHFGATLAAGDFNGDDCDDLAVGVPDEDIGAANGAGAVNVLYGGPTGLTGDNDDFWYQDLATVGGASESGDRFGDALAVGDFNDDGLADLAIGVPGEDIGAVVDAGLVHVLWGTIFGLGAGDSLTLYRGSGLNGSPQEGEHLGASLAAADFVALFAGDDLAVGAPGLDVSGADQAGGFVLISDLTGALFNSTWSQDSAGVPGVAEDFDRFGQALAAGDFDGDGLPELAVSAPEEDIGNPLIGSAGAVVIVDFDGDPMQVWTQDSLPPEQAEVSDSFGAVLAAGDFDGDGIDDLVIGVPEEDLGPATDAGLIHILFGEAGIGLTATRDQIWTQTIDPAETDDMFGFALAVGHFSGHSGADLAIGVPYDTLGALTRAGGVNTLFSIALFRDGFEDGLAPWSDAVP